MNYLMNYVMTIQVSCSNFVSEIQRNSHNLMKKKKSHLDSFSSLVQVPILHEISALTPHATHVPKQNKYLHPTIRSKTLKKKLYHRKPVDQ